MNLSIADFVVIGIVLIFAIVGLAKGLIKMIFSLSKKILATVGAYILVGPIRNWLTPTQIGEKINSTILDWLMTKNETLFSITDPTPEKFDELKNTLNVPNFLLDAFKKVFENNPGGTLGDAVSNTLTYYVLTILCFIVLFILLLLVISLIAMILSKVMEAPVLNAFNRITGMIVGIFLGLMIISLVMLVLSGVSNWFSWGNEFIAKYIDPANENFGIARWLYNNNLLVLILEKVLHFDEISMESLIA